MAGTTQDVNAALVRKVKGLSANSKAAFQKVFANAPLMLGLFQFLDSQKTEKFRTQDAVTHLYNIKISNPAYTLYENRFFKLRKKLYDHFHTSPAETHPVFTAQELQLHEIKNLTILGKYEDAYGLLVELENNLWKDNVFELLPDVLELLIHNNQVQKRMDQNEALYSKLDKVASLLSDLIEAKKMAREIYDTNLTKGINATTPLFNKLQRISINRKDYPRFKLIYNLISATTKLAGGGLDFTPNFKITNRFITVLNQIHAQHPQMPDYRFMAAYTSSQNYLFQNLKVMNYYNSLQFRDAADTMKVLFDAVVEPNSSMKRMKGDIFFSSSCMILTAGERYKDALDAANIYVKYLIESKQKDKLLNAYLEIVNIRTWLFSGNSGYSESFINSKLEEYYRTAKVNAYSHYFCAYANWLKIKLHLIRGEYDAAKKILDSNNFTTYFMDPALGREVSNSIALLNAPSAPQQKKKKYEEHIQKLKTYKLRCKLPPDYQNFYFLEKLITYQLRKTP